MRVLSDLATAAFGVSRHNFVPGNDPHAPMGRVPRAARRYQLMTVTVTSKDASKVRRALSGCANAVILNCCPMHRADKVKLEVRFPAGLCAEVMRQILACVPAGEIGCIVGCAQPLPRTKCGQERSANRWRP